MPAPELLVLARHARPEVDPARPSASWTLGVEGMEGSLRMAERLRHVGIDLVVSSVEPKAAETARLVASALDLPFQTGHDLHEHVRKSVGYLDRGMFEASVRRFFAEPSSRVFGDESADAAAARFGAAVDAIVRAHRDRRLCIVSHATVMSLHLERRFGADGWSTWKSLVGLPCYVVVERRLGKIVEVVNAV